MLGVSRHGYQLGFPIWIVVHGQHGLAVGIFFLFHNFSSLIYYFFSLHACSLYYRSDLAAFAPPNAPLQIVLKTPLPWFSFFSCNSFHLFPYPDATAGILRLWIFSRIARNNCRGTATSAIRKTTCRECRTTAQPHSPGEMLNMNTVGSFSPVSGISKILLKSPGNRVSLILSSSTVLTSSSSVTLESVKGTLFGQKFSY